MEIHPLGPCLLIDTPGFDDEGELGEMRVERTLKIIGKTDIALLLCETGDAQEQEWLQRLKERGIPVILILNKADVRPNATELAEQIKAGCGQPPSPSVPKMAQVSKLFTTPFWKSYLPISENKPSPGTW